MQNDVLIKTVDVGTVIEEFKYYVAKGTIDIDDLTKMFKELPQEAIDVVDTALAYALVQRERE